MTEIIDAKLCYAFHFTAISENIFHIFSLYYAVHTLVTMKVLIKSKNTMFISVVMIGRSLLM